MVEKSELTLQLVVPGTVIQSGDAEQLQERDPVDHGYGKLQNAAPKSQAEQHAQAHKAEQRS